MPVLRRSIPPFGQTLLVRLAPVVAASLFIVAIAAALRLQCLGCQSLWLDEVLTAEAARQPTVGGALTVAASWIDQAPLHYVLTWAMRAIGSDEFAIRLPYAIAGVLAALSMYGLASSLFGRFTGVVAGFLMAVLPYAVYYSQDANASILLILLTTLLMHAAHRAATRQRLIDWVLLAVVGVLSLYVGYLAIATLVAAYSYVVLVVLATWIRGRRGSGDRAAAKGVVWPAVGAMAAAVAIAVSFLPWAPYLTAFLGRRDVSFGRLASNQAATPEAVLGLLAQLDVQGPTIALFAAGIVVALIRSVTGRWREGWIPLTFLFVPIAGFLVIAGPGIVHIWPRYLSIVYPPIVLLVALGIVGLGDAMVLAWRRLSGSAAEGRRHIMARSLVTVPLSLLLGVSALAAVQTAQQSPKGSDYRGAVDRMMVADPIRPVVVVTGPNAAWVERGLVYYGWARGSGLRVIDGLTTDLHSLDDLRASTSLWLATREMDPSKVAVPSGATRSDHADFALLDIGMVDGAGVSAARDLLSALARSEPGLTRSVRLIDELEGDHPPGDELLPDSSIAVAGSGSPALERWTLRPGVTVVPDGSGFVASPAGGEVNAILATGQLMPGRDYLLRFGCRTADLRGALRAWVIATDLAGTQVYLDGSGERCRSNPGSGQSVIAFTVPDGVRVVTIQLQATGSGKADIGPISLHELR